MRQGSRVWGTLLAGVASLAFASGAQAALLTVELDFEFSGATAPQGATPWLTATFDDSVGGADTVRLTMSASQLVGSEFVRRWFFNFDPLLDPTQLAFSVVDNSDSVPGIATGLNAFKADGDGFFDIEFDFPLPPASSGARFTSGESVTYDLTYIAPITVDSFDHKSVMGGGNGSYTSAAHAQGIATSGDESGWIGNGSAPEPSVSALLVVGLLALAGRRARS